MRERSPDPKQRKQPAIEQYLLSDSDDKKAGDIHKLHDDKERNIHLLRGVPLSLSN